MKTGVEKQSQQARGRAASRAQQVGASGVDSALQRSVDESVVTQRQREQIEKSFGQPLQLQEDEEEELTGQAMIQRKADSATPNQTGLPDGLKAGLETLSGMDMSAVRVHYSSSKPAQLNALAYAQGNDIHLGAGQERHLPHEAWHTVQQRQGRVQSTMQMAGEKINDDAGLEKEADVMGDRASRFSG